MGTRVLVVEDEQDIAGLIKHALERKGDIEVDIADAGDAAIRSVSDSAPDLIVLDLNLPVLSGVEVCRIVRSRPTTAHIPIIMLTARSRRKRPRLGARAWGRRLHHQAVRAAGTGRTGPGGVAAGRQRCSEDAGDHLRRRSPRRRLRRDLRPGGRRQVRLTRREFELLRYLVENRNRVISSDRLLERVWGWDDSVETRSVDVHIGRLRSKLGVASSQIETVIGLGYRFID